MPDYKEMYLKLYRASESAIRTLIAVQQECEELYIAQPTPEFQIVPMIEEADCHTDDRLCPVYEKSEG